MASESTDEAYGWRSNPGGNHPTVALCVWRFQMLMQSETVMEH